MVARSDLEARRKTRPARPAALLLALGVLSACTTAEVLVPVPQDQVGYATIDPFKEIRFWADEPAEVYAELEKKRVDKIRAVYGDRLRGKVVPINYLCISGGGSNGALRRRVPRRLDRQGDAPQFNGVTGISTGSMIAPMAFLGTEIRRQAQGGLHDDQHRGRRRSAGAAGAARTVSGLADTAPLKKLIARFLTQAMLDEIAVESRKGRVLLIGTTNLESQRPIIWDIGAIAESGHPQALDLVREIILASASIPGAFPPVNISVTVDGKPYNEMHVDGGVTRQVFLYPPSYRPKAVDKAIGWKPKRTVYIIRNNKIQPEYAEVKPKLIMSPADRSTR